MKILVVCQYYYPEPFRIADICEELVRLGNEVTVVTGTPNYPMGNIYQGYENKKKSDETLNGVNVHRCAIHPRKKGIIHRLWNYYSFSLQSQKYINKLDSSYDVVFVYQLSPVMMANAGIKYAKKHGKRIILYSLDLWPASLGAGGLNHGVIYNWFHRESKKVYKAVDKILISSKSFAEYFEKEFGIKNTEYLPQCAEDTFSPDDCQKDPNGYIDLMFAGNVGSAQNVDAIIKAAALCKDIPHLRWHIVGDGKEIENCRILAKKLDVSIIFHGRKPLEEMPRYYAMADAMLVTMKKDPIISLTLPGKVQSYMAAGKFIIATNYGELGNIINSSKAGLTCQTDNADDFALCIRGYVGMKAEEREKAIQNSKLYYDKNFKKEQFFARLTEELF